MILAHYFQLFYFYRKLIVLIIVGLTGAVACLSAMMLFVYPFYTGTATIQLMPTEAELAYTRSFSTVGVEGTNPAETLPATYIEYLISKPVAERVFDKLAAQMDAAPEPEGWRHTVSEAVGETLEFAYMVYNTLNSGKYVEPTPRERAIAKLNRGIDIETVESSYILQIEVTLAQNAQAAAMAANALAEAYIERVSEQSAQTAEALIAYLETEIDKRKDALRQLQERQSELRKNAGILALEQERDALLSARNAEQERLLDIRIEREELKARLKAYEEDRVELRRRGTLAMVEQEIALSDSQMSALDRREALRMQSVDRINRQLMSLSEQENPLGEIEIEIARMEEEIRDLRNRQIAQKLSRTQNIKQLRIVNPATVPIYASSPKVVINTAVAGVAAVFIALFIMVAVDTLSESVKTTVDLRRLVGAEGLGQLPTHVTRQLGKNKAPGDKAKTLRILRQTGKGLESRMASQGLFESRSIQVTGVGSAELVSTASLALAGALAAAGGQVYWRSAADCTPVDPEHLERFGVGQADAIDDSLENSNGSKTGSRTAIIECIGPISTGFSWRDIADKSTAVMCVFPAGELTEEELLELRNAAAKHGVPEMAFLIVPS